AVDVLGVNTGFRPVNFRVGVQPVVTFRRYFIAKLRVALDGGAVGHRVAAVVRVGGLRVFGFLRVVVVVAQGAAQGLRRVDLPAPFRQHVVNRFIVRGRSAI